MKYSFTPLWYAYSSKLCLVNSSPLSIVMTSEIIMVSASPLRTLITRNPAGEAGLTCVEVAEIVGRLGETIQRHLSGLVIIRKRISG